MLRRVSPPPPAAKNRFDVQSSKFLKIVSGKEGQFTVYVGEKAINAFKELGIEFKDIEPLPQRVFDKCVELGFWHRDPVNLLVDVQEVPRDPSWTVCQVNPPIVLEPGKEIARSMVVFFPTVREEVEKLKSELVASSKMLGSVGHHARMEEALTAFPALIKTKYRTILTHELVHAFATDEHKPGLFGVLGLDLVELLTDAINVVTFYPDYKGAEPFIKTGFIEGAGYLVNLVREERPEVNSPQTAVELMHQRARKIIQDCRGRQASAAE